MAVRKSGARARGLRKNEETDLGFTWGMLNSVLLGLGAAVLVAGYIALSKGDITLAPLLLVSGYCGLIPASLLIRGRNQGSGE
jgi:drug/metabolite transporter (DMT)-like permease